MVQVDPLSLPYRIEPMTTADLDQVLDIERASFPYPWSARAFQAELASQYGIYRVACLVQRAVPSARLAPVQARWPAWLGGRRPARPGPGKGPILGYYGFQLVLDEGHIMTIAVHPDYRRRGLGELLLLDLFGEAQRRGALRLTLEVRVSNLVAQELYRKYGFTEEGRRLRYYADGEDALILWTGRLDTGESGARLQELREQMQRRLAGEQ
jgi:ribosomal-protein-alanine N-acetyltransferase